MATYKQIQEYVKQKHGYIPKSIEKQGDIKESFQYFNMI